MIWSNKPPTTSGYFWMRTKWKDEVGEPVIYWWNGVFVWTGGANMDPKHLLFGPPIPTPEQCAEIAKGKS